MNAWEREEEQLQKDLDAGFITQEEYNKAMRDIQRDYREAAQESAESAYEQEMQRW